MVINKKIVIYALIAVVMVAIATVGTVLILNALKGSAETKKPVVTKTTAKDLRAKAEEARAKNDVAESKALLLEAQEQYDELPKTDETSNAQEDIKAQLFLLENADKTTP